MIVFQARVEQALTQLQVRLPQAGSLRQVPIDMVAEAVARELLGLRPGVRIVRLKGEDAIADAALLNAVESVARRWAGVPAVTHPTRPLIDEPGLGGVVRGLLSNDMNS